MLHSNISRHSWTVRRSQSSQPRWLLFLLVGATLISNLPSSEARIEDADDYLTREGKKFVIDPKRTSRYERKLFASPDEVARYVFLTNAPNDGDRSVGVYRALEKKGSLPGHFWVTATKASDSLRMDNTRNVTVRRYDAPLPASTAKIVHELWLAMLERSQVEDFGPSSPTGIFAAKTASGVRIRAVTVKLGQNFRCWALMQVGESLINYPQIPKSQRVEAARRIEKESQRLLKRVSQGR